MSLSQPTPPNPYTSSAIQQQFSGQNLVNNALVNDVQQQTPYGSQTYQYAETPSGIPEITATQAYTPESTNLFNQFQGTQQNLGNQATGIGNLGTGLASGIAGGYQGLSNLGSQLGNNASTLAGNLQGSLTQPPNFLSQSSPQVQAQMAAYQGYMQPFYNMQTSNLNSMLQKQGIPQGSQAWNNAQMGLDTSMNQGAQSALMNFEPQAFNQAVQNYQIPIQTMAGLANTGAGLQGAAQGGMQGLLGAGTGLAQFGAPPGLNSTFYQQPMTGGSTGSVAPNYQQAAQAQYQAQQNQFQNTTGGLEQLGSGLLGFSGGGFGGIGAGIRGLFGGLGGAGQLTSNDSRIFD